MYHVAGKDLGRRPVDHRFRIELVSGRSVLLSQNVHCAVLLFERCKL
jgi:hypothetical protein